ncbi:MAG: phosphoribosylformylglycinamidine cyclo-ligase [Acidimicrobiia bacterium]
MSERLTYAASGVDIEAADDAVERIKAHVASTRRPEVLSEVGGFGGMFRFNGGDHEDSVLVSSVDGVGTKSVVAAMVGNYDTIGIDLVGTADDIAVSGAEPLFFLDYISVPHVDPEMIESIVAGIARGCRQAGYALVGGEISEHPDSMEPGSFDLVGCAVGAVDREKTLPSGIAEGDALIGFASPGLRCNGYSLARRALFDHAQRKHTEAAWAGADRTLGEELLVPSVIYTPAMLQLRNTIAVKGFAHITGGGLAANLQRVMPEGLGAHVRRGSWPEPRIFEVVQNAGDIADAEMQRVFNLGIGMVAVVAAHDAAAAIESIAASGIEALEIGRVETGPSAIEPV